MSMRRPIVVVGSINEDIVIRVPRMAAPGETVIGSDMQTFSGGKGANQAVAAAKLGGTAAMMGRIGQDVAAERVADSLQGYGVDVSPVIRDPHGPTGLAMIFVDDAGENSIVVAPGTNFLWHHDDVKKMEDLVAGASILMVQLEIPLPVVTQAISAASAAGVPVILDPAPAQELPADLLAQVDVITPNEQEAAVLTGMSIARGRDAEQAAFMLHQRGVQYAVVKRGAAGAVMAGADGIKVEEGLRVDVVDTTAAGDTFGGALAVALAEGRSMADALTFANHAGALAVTKMGAQPSIPTREEVDRFLKESGGSG